MQISWKSWKKLLAWWCDLVKKIQYGGRNSQNLITMGLCNPKYLAEHFLNVSKFQDIWGTCQDDSLKCPKCVQTFLDTFWTLLSTLDICIFFLPNVSKICPKCGHILDSFDYFGYFFDVLRTHSEFGHFLAVVWTYLWTLSQIKCPKCVRTHIAD